MGLIGNSLPLMNSLLGVTIVLVNVLLIFMVIPILSALSGIPRSLSEAAQTLAANRLRVWWHVTWPLSAPGVVSGFVLVFALALSSYVDPRIIGGAQFFLVPIQMYSEVNGSLNWPLGSAMGFVLLGVSLLVSTLVFIGSRYVFPHQRRHSIE